MSGGSPGEFAVGWGTLSLLNAGLAQAKGRSGFVWWFFSLFLGPLVTLLLVLLDPPRSRKPAVPKLVEAPR